MPVVINGTTGITTPTESVATTIGVGGATPSASGAGVTFPASQSASSSANTLDDYEEGSWFPAFVGGTSDPTVAYAEQVGRYTKIGDVVHFSIRLVTSSTSGGSGQLRVTLPFTTANYSTGIGGGCFINFGYNFNLSGGIQNPQNGYVQANTNYLFLKPNITDVTELSVANLSGAAYLNVAGFFYVA